MNKLLLLVLLCGITCDAVWVNSKVSRTIDLKSHIVKISISASLRNDGPSAAKEFEIQVDSQDVANVAYLSATLSDSDDTKLKIKATSEGVYKVELPESVSAGSSIDVKIEEYITRSLKPFPEKITQSQKQLVTYSGNHLFYSPYVTESQTTTVELPSSAVENHSKYGDTELQDSTIKYGGSDEYSNVKPLSQSAMDLHFENNSPFLTVTKMTRVIEVSHWGNIAVEETLDILHTGAQFKGTFSRYDYQRLPNSGIAAVKSFKTILPASASDVYYRDEIGNISTSNLLAQDDSVEMEIRPRFPLFGGWKTHYYIGYNLPSYTYLYKTGDLLALRMRFVDHVYDDMVIDELTVKVILPESSKKISVNMPYQAERLEDSLHYTYLDTTGRPVISFRKKNVVEPHIQDFTLSYNFNRLLLLQEPLLVVGAFFLLFFTVILIARLDFSITTDKISEARLRLQSVIEQIQEQQVKRSSCYDKYEKAIKSYKASKDTGSLAATRKAIEKTHKEITTTMTGLIAKMSHDSTEIHEKALQIMKTDQNIMDKYHQCMGAAEKLLSKKMTKDQYITQEDKLQSALDKMKEEIEEACDNL